MKNVGDNMNNKFLLIVSLLILNYACIYAVAQENDDVKSTILKAINETADAAMNTLLDKEGKSKCDYNISEGKWYEYEPPWHTGQVIYSLVEAYKITSNKNYFRAASRAGDWWCSLLITDHPVLKGMVNAIHGDGIENIIFATVSDGSAGLFRLFNVTKNNKFASVPTGAGEWMLNNMYIPEKGLFYDAVDPLTGKVLKDKSPFWPEKEEQTLYDVSRPNNEGSLYLDMFRYTGNEKYKEVFINLCNSLVEKQDPNGLWMDFTPNNKAEGSIHPRFNLWYAESLIDGYELTKEKRYLDAAVKTLTMYKSLIKKDGTFYYTNYVDGRYNENSITGSATAFLGILWIRLAKLGFEVEYRSYIELAFNWLLKNRFSNNHPDSNLRGTVIDTRTKIKKGKVNIIQRDVGTSFGLRFLCDYYNYLFSAKQQ